MTIRGTSGPLRFSPMRLSVALLLLFSGLLRAQSSRTVTIPVTSPLSPKLECIITAGAAVPAAALAFSPDGKTIAAGGYREIVLWDIAEGKLSRRLATGQLSTTIRSLLWTTDRLIIGEGDPGGRGAVRVIDTNTGQIQSTFDQPRDVVHALDLSPDCKLLAAASADGHAYVWKFADKTLVATLKEHVGWVNAVAFSPDGKVLVTGGADRALLLWDVESWKVSQRTQLGDAIAGLAFSPDGQMIAAAVGGPNERGVRTRRRDDLRAVRSYDTSPGIPTTMHWVHAGNRIVVPTNISGTRIFDVTKGTSVTYPGGAEWICSAAISPDGARVAAGGGDGVIRMFDAASARLLASSIQLRSQGDDWLIITANGHYASSAQTHPQWITGDARPSPDSLAALRSEAAVRQALLGRLAVPAAPPAPTTSAAPSTPRSRFIPNAPKPAPLPQPRK